ncbi:hypothetical protein BD779DRAFT_1554978 [Infundibulicybe gibba]|nr:hypothetical protein BD779DRAFT_1554978 [Infundibulicybe gibba]
MCDSIKTHNGLMISYLLFVSGKEITADDQIAANKIANKMLNFVTEDWDDIDTASSYDILSALDSTRNSWRNEDPSRENALKQADQDTSPADSLITKLKLEGVAKAIDGRIIVQAQTAAKGEAKAALSQSDDWIGRMQKIAVSGALDKQAIMRMF